MQKTENKSIQDLAIDYIETKSNESFNLLYKRIYPNLRNFAKNSLKQYCKSNINDNLDDVMSKVFYKVIKNIDQYNRMWNFSTWVYAICKNELSLQRKYIFKHVSLDNFNSGVGDDIRSEDYLLKSAIDKDSLLSSADLLEEQERLDDIDKLYNMTIDEILTLPDLYKQIVVDREIYNLKYDELADKYNLPIQTIKNRIRIGRNKIKDSILKKLKKINIDSIYINNKNVNLGF